MQKQTRWFPLAIIVAIVLNFGFTSYIYFKKTATTKIAYLDAIQLIGKYKGTNALKADLDLKASGWRANLDTLKSEFEKLNANFEKNKSKLPPNSKLEEAVIKKRQQYLDYQQVIEEKIKKSEKEAMDAMLIRVNETIEKYGHDHGYSIILSGTQLGVIAYADKGLDVTNEILEIINRDNK